MKKIQLKSDHYIPFEKDTDEKKNDFEKFQKAFANLISSLKSGEISNTPFLFAKYTGRDDHGADIDNVLLYNTGLNPKNVAGMILERDRESKSEGFCYEYSFCSEEEFDRLLEERTGEYVVDTGWLENTNEPGGEGAKVVHFYNLFRKWLCSLNETVLNNKSAQLNNGDFEMVVLYNGESVFSESGFVKRIVDGVISAMEAFNPKQNCKKIEGICSGRNEVSLLNSGNNHYTINGKGWNPQDHLLGRLILKKDAENDNCVRIMIRPM